MSMKKSKNHMNLYDINRMDCVQIVDEWELPDRLEESSNLLVFVLAGKGEIHEDHSSTSIEKGGLLVYQSNMAARSTITPVTSMSIYYIEFSCATVFRQEGKWCIENDVAPVQGKVNVGELSIVYHYLKKLHDNWLNETAQMVELQCHFSEIWNVISTEMSERQQKLDAEQSIEKMTKHINLHYKETYQIEKMAQFSGMNATSFYQQFKDQTSLTPLQYITKKRIDKARMLLMTGKANIHEAAKAVGYPDVYYFSRVFKKTIGVPPVEYQKLLQRKIVVLCPAFVGDLMALGIPRERIVLLLDEERQQKHRLKNYANAFSLDRIHEEKPDLIIGTYSDAPKYDNLSEIAPTWLIPYKQKSWREQFILLASIIGVEEVALNWLRFYDLKSETARGHILKKVQDETVLAARISQKGVRVFGEKRRKVGDLLYRDLKLQAPISTSSFHFEDVRCLKELDDFNADHILLLDEQSDRHTYSYTSLSGNIHRAYVSPWLHYSALGQARALEEAVMFFAGKKLL